MNIKAKCIRKIKDKNGVITDYVLIDKYNKAQTLSAKQLKNLIQNGVLEVINLTLTSDNRLIDTSINTSMSTSGTTSNQLLKLDVLEHNKIAFECVLKKFETSDRTAVIQPTGTGKSYVALQLIRKALMGNSRVLFITSMSINLNNFRQLVNKYAPNAKITYSLYHSLGNLILFKDVYDYIIVDEYHRAGAGTFGENLNKILENNQRAKVLGLTATPIRYLDGMTDMTEMLFDNNVAHELTLTEAMHKGILPVPKYITCQYSYTNEFNAIEARLKNGKIPDDTRVQIQELVDEARKQMVSTNFKGITSLFKDYIQPGGKYIVFCSNSEHLFDTVIPAIRDEWCQHITNKAIYCITSDFGTKAQNREIYSKFEENTPGITKFLLVINMLNEGVHIKNIDGVIMLRATCSGNIYFQQLGRAFSTDWGTKQPLILDIVANFKSLKALHLSVREVVKHEKSGYTKHYNNDIFHLISYQKNLDKILEDIHNMLRLSFDNYINLCKEYIKESGEEICTITKYKGVNIGQWVGHQKQKYKCGNLTKDKIDKLNALGLLAFYEDEWNNKYEIARQLIDSGKTILNRTEYNGVNIGAWVNTQKQKYKNGNLTQDQIDRLNSLGLLVFREGTIATAWNNKYELARQLVESGTQIVDRTKYKGVNIGQWVADQKKKYKNGNLTQEQIDKLHALGILVPYEDAWNNSYELARQLIESGEKIIENTKYKGINIGKWVHNQKQNYKRGSLTKDKIDKLNGLGLLAFHEDAWNNNYELARQLIESGTKIVHNTKYKGVNIGQWVDDQKKKYKNGRLTQDQRDRLNELGLLVFREGTIATEWNNKYELARQLVESGEKIVTSTKYNGVNIGQWVDTQKKNYKNGNLTQEQIDKLKTLGLLVFLEDTWNNKYELARQLVESGNKIVTSTKYNGVNIGQWVDTQKQKYKNKKLTKDQINKLKALNLI